MPLTGAQRYSEEQLLRGLRFAVEPFNYDKIPVEADTPLSAVVGKEDVWQLDVQIRRYFAINLSRENWMELILHRASSNDEWRDDIWPVLTFGTIADFLGRVASPASLDAISILGRGCEAAGAFRGIQQIVSDIGLDPDAIAPNSRVRSHLRGSDLLHFWKRLQILVGDDIPSITDNSWRIERITGPLTLLCLPVIMIATFLLAIHVAPLAGALWKPLEGVLFFAVLGIIIWRTLSIQSILGSLIECFVDPIELPPGIRTFRDLSVLMARRHHSDSSISAA